MNKDEIVNADIPQSFHHFLNPLTTTEGAGFAAWAVQCFGNGIIRQAISNLKQIADFGNGKSKYGEIFKKDPKAVLTQNMGKRLAYQATGIYPALWVRNKLTENGATNFSVSLAVAATETLMRSAVESYSGRKMLEKELGIEASQKQVLQIGYRTLMPFFFRNYFSWLVINQDSENSSQKIIKGGISGIISTPFETLGNLVMRHSINSQNIAESYNKAWNSLIKGDKTLLENLARNLMRGASLRGAAGIGSVLLLSPDCSNFLTNEAVIPLALKLRAASSSGLKADDIIEIDNPEEISIAPNAPKSNALDSNAIDSNTLESSALKPNAPRANATKPNAPMANAETKEQPPSSAKINAAESFNDEIYRAIR